MCTDQAQPVLLPPVEPGQYTSKDYANLCRELGVVQSMGRVGSSADNALAEAFNATVKRETLRGAIRWGSARDARLPAFKWIINYNARRRHSACGYLSPTAYEHTLTAATLPAAA